MTENKGTNWENLKGKYIRIKTVRYLPLLINETDALVLEVNDKKVKLRNKGNKIEVSYSVLNDGYNTLRGGWLAPKQRFMRELTKWEILEFEVADYIGGFYNKSGINFDDELITVSKEECEYMQKSAEFEMEEHLPIKNIAGFIIALIFFSEVIKTEVEIWFYLLFGIFFYLHYYWYRKRYTELILKLEARILSLK
ncbi:MAG: hypothetical protein KAT05_12820 [Spirochaetes bacterium]|nr:hypothetical protein [Spirochaetota bacterium]